MGWVGFNFVTLVHTKVVVQPKFQIGSKYFGCRDDWSGEHSRWKTQLVLLRFWWIWVFHNLWVPAIWGKNQTPRTVDLAYNLLMKLNCDITINYFGEIDLFTVNKHSWHRFHALWFPVTWHYEQQSVLLQLRFFVKNWCVKKSCEKWSSHDYH